MPRRSHVSLTVDPSKRLLVIRLFNVVGNPDGMPDLIDHLSQVREPWTYNAIFDFRRYEADLTRNYLAFLTQKWAELTKGRDQDTCMALITPDLDLKARLGAMMDVMPGRAIAIFDTFDEGLDWVGSHTEKLSQAS